MSDVKKVVLAYSGAPGYFSKSRSASQESITVKWFTFTG